MNELRTIYFACTMCKLIEEVSEFTNSLYHRHDGVTYVCKPCVTRKEAAEFLLRART